VTWTVEFFEEDQDLAVRKRRRDRDFAWLGEPSRRAFGRMPICRTFSGSTHQYGGVRLQGI
jgi:hypothetical protein